MTKSLLRPHGFPLVFLALTAACDQPETEAESIVQAASYDHTPRPERELVITDVSVVDDPFYTRFAKDKANTDPQGGWSFGRLMDNLSPFEKPSPAQRTRWVTRWLKLWEADQVINGFVVPARPSIRSLVLDPWRVASGCAPDAAPLGQIAANDRCVLDMAKAPFRLLAVVYRPDLRVTPSSKLPKSSGSGGQGRFVFGVLGKDAAGAERRLAFTVIFEYRLPISSDSDILSWAEKWHRLGRNALSFGSAYNKELHDVTRNFTKWKLLSNTPNGSALLQIRTNEASLSTETPKLWEMREFVIHSSGDRLVMDTVKQEPDITLNGSAALVDFVRVNETRVLDGTYEVPNSYYGAPFLAGRALVPAEFVWSVPGVSSAARDRFAMGTCSGCHFAETGGAAGTNFLHVKNRAAGAAAALSPFLHQELVDVRVPDFASLLLAADGVKLKDGPGLDRGNE